MLWRVFCRHLLAELRAQGDGRNLLLAARLGMQAIGIESNPLLAALSIARAHLEGLPVTVHAADFDTTALPDAHLVFTYLSHEAMHRLAPVLLCARAPVDKRSGQRPFARVLSRDFELPGLQPWRSVDRARTRLLVYEATAESCALAQRSAV